jgi:hypothetical protein
MLRHFDVANGARRDFRPASHPRLPDMHMQDATEIVRPDLQKLVAEYGSYSAIPPAAWAEFDAARAAYDQAIRAGELQPPKSGSPPPPATLTSMKPVSQMTLAEIQAELRWYQPRAAHEVNDTDEHKQRRVALWRRLDALVAPGEAEMRLAR